MNTRATINGGAEQRSDLLLAVHERFEHLDSMFRMASNEDGLLASSARELWMAICDEASKHSGNRRHVHRFYPNASVFTSQNEAMFPPRATVRILQSETRSPWM